MNINLTLFGEMLTFAVLVWVMMKYVWPPLMRVIENRQQQIASGLEAAAQGKRELEAVKAEVGLKLQQAKIDASKIIDIANQQANNLLEAGRNSAQEERYKILAQGKLDLNQEVYKAQDELKQQTADLVIALTEKILQQKIDAAAQRKLIDGLIASVKRG